MSVIQIDGVEIGFSTDGKQAFARKNGIATPLVDLPAPYSLSQQLIEDLTRLLGRMSTRIVSLGAEFNKVDKPSGKSDRFAQFLVGVILLQQDEIDRITRMKGFHVPAKSGIAVEVEADFAERLTPRGKQAYKTIDPTTLAERVSSQLGELNA